MSTLQEPETERCPDSVVRKVALGDLPQATSLFHDYIAQFARVAAFYPGGDPDDTAAYQESAQAVLGMEFPRDEVADVLRDQNQVAGAPQAVLDNIERLREADTGAVVAGQQVAIFGGPLYTLYKALTIARMADCMEKRGIAKCVPIFWMATDDHDQDEVSWADVICAENQVHHLTYEPDADDVGKPVHMLTLNDTIERALSDMESCTLDTEFKADVIRDLREAYRPGVKLSDAFARWLTKLVGRYGVILADPSDPRLKRLAAKTFRKAILDAEPITRDIMARGAALREAGYHEQVHVHEGILNVFISNGGRRPIHFDSTGYRVDAGGDTMSQAELLALLDAQPERFSANVCLRPVVQDMLFPTIAFVAGPSEIAYLAQVSAVYPYCNRRMPVVVARAGFSLVEEKIAKLVTEYDISLDELARQDDSLALRLTRETMPSDLLDLFAAARARIGESLDPIIERLRELDPTLIPTAEKGRGAIGEHIDGIEKKIVASMKRREDTLAARVDKVRNALMPGGSMQERRLNISYFLIKYGSGIIDHIYAHTACPTKDHVLLRVP